jgi:serine/threonine protein kinase
VNKDPRRDPGEPSLALRDLLSRFVAVCNEVAYAHSQSVVNRDIKPANAMFGEFGETLVVDWGLAKAIGRRSEQRSRRNRNTGKRTPTWRS